MSRRLPTRNRLPADALLLAQYREGMTAKALALKYGSTGDTVAKRLREAVEAETHGRDRSPSAPNARSPGSSPGTAPTLALELDDRIALVTDIDVEPALACAAITVSAFSVIADLFGAELGISRDETASLAELREQMRGGGRTSKYFGHPALWRVSNAVRVRDPEAHQRLLDLCDRVAAK